MSEVVWTAQVDVIHQLVFDNAPQECFGGVKLTIGSSVISSKPCPLIPLFNGIQEITFIALLIMHDIKSLPPEPWSSLPVQLSTSEVCCMEGELFVAVRPASFSHFFFSWKCGVPKVDLASQLRRSTMSRLHCLCFSKAPPIMNAYHWCSRQKRMLQRLNRRT